MPPTAGHNIIVVGASAGGVEALVNLTHGLPDDLAAAVFIVLHMPPHSRSHLPEILSRAGVLPSTQPVNGQMIEPGHIYTALPDYHLLVDRDRIRIAYGPKENGSRPAIDPLFRSAARAYGPRVIGVVLSGALDDGTAGLSAIRRRGGLVVVQDPADALVADMPANALEYVQADYVGRAADMGAILGQLARLPVSEGDSVVLEDEDLERETRIAEGDPRVIPATPPGTLTVFACPDCGGPLWEMRDGGLMRFRCRNGHGYSADGLMEGQTAGLEEALWAALNTLESSAQLTDRMARDAAARGNRLLAERMEAKAQQTTRRAELIRGALLADGADGANHSRNDTSGAHNGAHSLSQRGADPRAQPIEPHDS